MKKILSILIFFAFLVPVSAGTLKEQDRQQGFVENKGQVLDQDQHPNDEVKYLYSGNGFNVQLRRNGFSYDLYTLEKGAEEEKGTTAGMEQKFPVPGTYRFNRIDVEFIDANASPRITAAHPLEGYTNHYFAGGPGQGVLGVHTYSKVMYTNLYDGIDLEFTLDQDKKVKFNFIVHAGYDARKIRWTYHGALASTIVNGKIVLVTEQGTIEENIPLSYLSVGSQGVEIKYACNARNRIFGFDVPAYDRSQALIIDPVPWVTYYGGNSNEFCLATAIDTSGNIYFGGQTSSFGGIATSGAHKTTFTASLSHAYLVKFNASGSRQWGTYYGGDISESIAGIRVNKGGDIYAIGGTSSTVGISTTGAHQTSIGGSSDAFLVKFDSSGVRQWGTYYGGSGSESALAIALDTSGNAFIGGGTSSTTGISSTGAYQTTKGTVSDAFLVKFNSNGVRQWGTYYGGNDEDGFNAIIVDDSANIFAAGQTSSTTAVVSTGAHQTTIGGGWDGLLVKFNSSGVRQWGTYYGGSLLDKAFDVGLDTSRNIYVSGFTESTGAISTSGAHQSSNGGGGDAFVVKFNAYGVRQWGTYYGGSGKEGSNLFTGENSLAVEANGIVCLAGTTNSTSGISNSWAYQTTLAGTYDGFITKFSTSGVLLWGTYYGGSLNDNMEDVVLNDAGAIYFSGYTVSTSGISTSGAYQPTIAGNIDAFAGILTSTGGISFVSGNTISGAQSVCPGIVPGTTLTGSTPTGGNSSYEYQWQRSEVHAGYGYSNATGASNQKNYSAPALSVSTYFRRIIFSAGCVDTSAPVLISMITTPVPKFTINSAGQCLRSNSFVLTDSSYISSGSFVKLWTYGNGDTSTANQLTFSYVNTGAYTFKLNVTGNLGCKDSLIKTITVHPQAQLAFSVNDSDQCKGGNLFQLTNNSSVSSGSYTNLWNFGDGNTSSVASPSKSYGSAGLFTIKLLVTTNYGCKDSLSKQVQVYPDPGAGFAVNNIVQCLSGNVFIFSDTSTWGYSRSWDLGNGDTASDVSISRSYPSANVFAVKLTSKSVYGCKDSVIKSIRVYPQATPAFSINDSDQCQSGNNFVFTDNSSASSGTFSSLWNFGNGNTSTQSNPSVSYSSASSYSVKLVTTTNFGCKDSLSKTVMVHPQAMLGYSVNDSDQCLNTNAYMFTNISSVASGTLSYQWLFGDNSSSTQVHPTKTYTGVGLYSIKLSSTTDKGCKDSLLQSVTVYPNPSALFSSDLAQCLAGNSFSLSNTSSGSPTACHWDFGNSTSSTSVFASVSYASTGTYPIRLVAMNSFGCLDTVIHSVRVKTNPSTPLISYSPDTIVCNNVNIVLKTNSSDAKSWMKNGSPLGVSLDSLIVVNTAGAYSLKVTNTENCEAVSVTRNLSFKAVPSQPIVTLNGNVFTSSATAGNQWYNSSGAIAGATAQTYQATKTGQYYSIVTVNSCASPASTSHSFPATSISSVYGNQLQVYPNPNIGSFTISTGNATGSIRIRMFDITGRVVMDRTTEAAKEIQVEDKGLSTGTYILELSLNDRQERHRLIIRR